MKKYVVAIGIFLLVGVSINAKQLTKNILHIKNYHSCMSYSQQPLNFSAFSEDFESGAVGWETKDLTPTVPATWHPDTFNAYGGSGLSWWAGDTVLKGYSDTWYQVLTSPEVTLPSVACTLSFKMNYHAENPAGAEAPYDGWDGCNVRISTDGGSSWTVLTDPVPSYNCASLYSFGSEHWEGPNVPGWGGSSGGWIDVTFDLSDYQGQNVKIRWAFASDPAACTADSAAWFGMQIDDINIAGVLTNNGEDTTGFKSESMVQAVGDYWALTDSSYHSASHSYHCPNGKKFLNALASPAITLPDTTPLLLNFWVYCDMPDWDGNGDQYLDDYYYVAISTDSTISWDNTDSAIGADYAYRGADTSWVMRDSLLISGNPVALNLDIFKGQTIRLEFIIKTDNDDNGGVGKGLYIDDINIGSPGVEENVNPKADNFEIKNLPNPFTLKTAISIKGVKKGELSIYDLGGRLVRTFAINSGSQSLNTTIIWDGKDENSKPVPTGMYIYKLTSDNFSTTKKMVLLR